MMWFDSDALVGKEWDKDPMKVMVENNLAILYAGFPYGNSKNLVIKDKIAKVYDNPICQIYQVKGVLVPKVCEEGMHFRIGQIAGNHHITNLDVYRKDIHQKFLKAYVGDHRFSREFDDQFAVTLPAAMEGPNLAWEERASNLTLMIGHHHMFDVRKKEYAKKVPKGFFDLAKETWPGLQERCGAFF